MTLWALLPFNLWINFLEELNAPLCPSQCLALHTVPFRHCLCVTIQELVGTLTRLHLTFQIISRLSKRQLQLGHNGI